MTNPVAIEELVAQYIEYAATELVRGKQRTSTTITSYRRALDGFVVAFKSLGIEGLQHLPADFITTNWMPTQTSIINQPVQLRIRAAAVKNFINWAASNGHPVATLNHPDLPTPKKEEHMTTPNITELADQNSENPVPSAYSAPALPTTVPLPVPRNAAPQPAPRAAATRREENPLAAMFQQPGYKLRVRRERDGDDAVYVGDYKAEKVRMYGAIEPFLTQEVSQRLIAAGITGDVTFTVCPVSPSGAEGEMRRITIAVMPTTAHAPSPAPMAVPMQGPTGPDVADLMANATTIQRRTLEDVEERLSQRLQPQSNSEVSELKSMVMSLAQSVSSLSEKMSHGGSRDSHHEIERVRPAEFNIDAVVNAVVEKLKPAVAPPQQQSGLGEMMGVFREAREMFQPQNVQIDVSPLEEKMHDLQKQMQNSKKDDISDMLVKMKAMKELFGLLNGEQAKPQPATIGSAVGGFLSKLIENPGPLADAAERVLLAAGSLGGAPPEGEQRRQLPAPKKGPEIPEPTLTAIKAWLRTPAKDGGALIVAGHEMFTLMMRTPAINQAVPKMNEFVRENQPAKLAIYLRNVFTNIGINVEPVVVAERAKSMLDAMFAQQNPPRDEEEEEDTGPADLTVRVGGTMDAAADDGEDENDGEEGDEGTDEGEDASGDEDAEGDEDEGDDEGGEEEGAEDAPADSTEEDPEPQPEPAVTTTVTLDPDEPAPTPEPKRKRKNERDTRPPVRG